MIIRKIRKNGILNPKKIIKRVVILLVVCVIFKGIQYLIHQNAVDFSRITSMQAGDSVEVLGTVIQDNNFPYYTHSIVDNNNDKIGLKSASINLNEYTGKVEIGGKIEKFLKLVPVVEVDTVKFPEQGLIIKDKRYYFTKDFLYLDFTTQPQLSAIRSGNEIEILFGGKTVLSIERFLCSVVIKNQNCTALTSEYSKNRNDNFDAVWGYTYYKHSSGVWITFDGDRFGYVFKNVDDTMMLDLSNMIRIVNKDFIMDNKMSLIRAKCADKNSYLQTIQDASMSYRNPQMISLTLTGSTEHKQSASCIITFDDRNNRTVPSATFTLGE